MNKRRIWTFLIVMFVVVNVIAFFHAYKFTHFSSDANSRTDPRELSFFGKVATLALGVDNPRPVNADLPAMGFETLTIPHEADTIECWRVLVDSAIGTVIIFHGYAGNKSQMIKESDQFNKLGYNTILVDFLGSGGSTGNSTSIGFHESDQVKAVFDFASNHGADPVTMFGTSMGAVAIMKSIHDHNLKPESIILECPFGNMLQTVQARFRIMGAPVFPMSQLLTFWGGVQHAFNAFEHNPTDYARSIEVKTLLMYGMKDDRVSLEETELIFENLTGPKQLKRYPEAGHESILKKNENEWINDVVGFLNGSF